MNQFIVLVSCPDEMGLIAKVSKTFFDNNLNIIVMKEFVEEKTNRFFMRSELFGELNKEKLEKELERVLPPNSSLVINPKSKKEIVVMVTKEHHCLATLLTKHYFNELNASILAVIGNYDTLQDITSKYGVPFFYITHENKTRDEYEKEKISIITKLKPDYIVLAKYMRILSENFVHIFENKILNIHHSFLPAFIGANPYKQAYDRGVKLIGATAHIVTNDLDDGPIIVQQVSRVDHTFTVQKMVQTGHETEAIVLAKALQLLVEDRVFIFDNKTILFT